MVISTQPRQLPIVLTLAFNTATATMVLILAIVGLTLTQLVVNGFGPAVITVPRIKFVSTATRLSMYRMDILDLT